MCITDNNLHLQYGFQSNPKFSQLTEKDYILVEDVSYYCKLTDTLYTIPRGFNTDFASVPEFMQWLLKPDGQYKYESCLHDYIYLTRSVKVTRKQADDIFKEAMSIGIVDKWKEVALYIAVRLFGGHYFKKRS